MTDLTSPSPRKRGAAPKTRPAAVASHRTSAAPRLVPAVERAVRVLDTLASAGRPLSLAELARALTLPRSSLHGLLATLVHLDLARRDPNASFRPGARPLQWAGAWNGQAEVVESFQRQAHALSALAAETVMLAALDGAEVVYLACRPGLRSLEINFRVGGRLPAAIASSGKAMLASLDDATVREHLADYRFDRITPHSVGSMGSLLKQLRQFRQAGHAVDDEEAARGMLCLGAAIHTPAQGPTAQDLSAHDPSAPEHPVRNISTPDPSARGLASRSPLRRAQPAPYAVAVSVIKAGLRVKRRRELEQAVRALAQAITRELQTPGQSTAS
ncbi:MAG: IclR family transcriptional regulator [Burkholderiaceae bacterium]